MMPYDAVKQGFRDLIHEDAEILLESWNVFYESLRKHTNGEDNDAIYLLGNLWDTKGNITYYRVLDMDKEQQENEIKDLTQELKDFFISEEESRIILAILMYAADQSEARSEADPPESKATSDSAKADDKNFVIAPPVLEKTDLNSDNSLQEVTLYGCMEPDIAPLFDDESHVFLQSDEEQKTKCFITEIQTQTAKGDGFGTIATETGSTEASVAVMDFLSSDQSGLSQDSFSKDQAFDELQQEEVPEDGTVSPPGAYTLEQELNSLTAYHSLLLKREEEGLPRLSLPLHLVLTGGRENDRREAANVVARYACELGFLEEYVLYEGKEMPCGSSTLWYIRLAELDALDLNRIARAMERKDYIVVLSGTQKEINTVFGLCPPLSLGYVHQVHIGCSSNASSYSNGQANDVASQDKEKTDALFHIVSGLTSSVQDYEHNPNEIGYKTATLQNVNDSKETDNASSAEDTAGNEKDEQEFAVNGV